MTQNTVKIHTRPEEKIIDTPLDEIVRQGARKMLQQALEIEVDSFKNKKRKRQSNPS